MERIEIRLSKQKILIFAVPMLVAFIVVNYSVYFTAAWSSNHAIKYWLPIADILLIAFLYKPLMMMVGNQPVIIFTDGGLETFENGIRNFYSWDSIEEIDFKKNKNGASIMMIKNQNKVDEIHIGGLEKSKDEIIDLLSMHKSAEPDTAVISEEEEKEQVEEHNNHVGAFLIGLLLLGVGVYMMFEKPPKPDQLIAISGTFKSMESKSKGLVWLFINEKDNRFEIKPFLTASHSPTQFDERNFIGDQKAGDQIQITIRKEDQHLLGDDSQIEVIGLRSDKKEYFGLNEYSRALARDKDFLWALILGGAYSVYLGLRKKKIEVMDVVIGGGLGLGFLIIEKLSG